MNDEAHTAAHVAEVAVVGAGAAGLYAALVAAEQGARVALVSSSPLAESASYWAQGGIAAALAEGDSPEQHARDTITAGRRACRASAVRILCEDAPDRVRDLERMGVRFDADRDGALALGLEGGHSQRRVVHAGGSATGRRITRELSALVAAHERIDVFERTTATALRTSDGLCVGVATLAADGTRASIDARATILATGGAAALWARTTNPAGAVGAGMTLALAAGAALADMELVQFHPTALVSEARDGFLITEAIRGEGAVLLDAAGERFVDELAPRDEVALAVQARLRGGPVRLDMRAVDPRLFPNVANALRDAGFDPARDTIPVAPAAHYVMGGVATDLDGQSTLPGLFAVGECACTGLHGANRLASNSLAECVVFGHRAAIAACAQPEARRGAVIERTVASSAPDRSTRDALWLHAGLERTADGLAALLDDPFPLARAIASCALAREESRGAHQRRDRPELDPAFDCMHAVVRGTDPPLFERWD